MNYIGSKRKLLSFLIQHIEAFSGIQGRGWKNVTFCDLFAGTGVVGAAFRAKGAYVIANDLMAYSEMLNRFFLESDSADDLLLEEIVAEAKFLLKDPDFRGFVAENYSPAGDNCERLYFTPENARLIDAINLVIKTELDSDKQRAAAKAALLFSADKAANVASVYGAYLKSVKASAQKELELQYPSYGLFDGLFKGPIGKVYRKDAVELVKEISGDVLYLDPPYNTRQYISNYHVLETIALNDDPELTGKTGLRANEESKKSLFCSKRHVAEQLDNLVASVRFEHIFLSYNNKGLLSFDEIMQLLGFYGEVSVVRKPYQSFKADKDENRVIDENETIEFLFYLRKSR